MSWIAKQLSPVEKKLVAAYYAGMPYSAGSPSQLPPPMLYVTGDPARSLPSCASCHGLSGEGFGPAFPPLAGQPSPYLAEQMRQWRHSRRRSDPKDMMLHVSQRLTPAEIEALAAYAASLAGGPPNRGSPAAFPEARRGGPRNDASGPPLHVPGSARTAE